MNVQNYTFRDSELKSPKLRLLNHVGSACAKFGMLPTLNADHIVAMAIDRTGLKDFGGDSYREPLEVYLHAVEHEANLNTLGRLSVREMLIMSLINRLQVIDWHSKHPGTANEKIEKPWIIVGLPRTGTSLLSILLGLNPKARSLLQWEAASPIPPPDLANALTDTRISTCQSHLDQLLDINPPLRAMHPFGAMLAQECTALFMYDLRTIGLETQAFVPSYGEWLSTASMDSAYHMHKLTLQALQSAQPTEHWVLKSPNHLWCLDQLMLTYPDARIIWTHRNPSDIVVSLASLTNALQRPLTKNQKHKAVAEDWNKKLFNATQSAAEFDQRQTSNWCYHLQYEELIENPQQAIVNIYTHFGMDVDSLHNSRINKWMDCRPQSTFGRHQYSASDFGWTKEKLNAQYHEYALKYCKQSLG